MTTGKIIALIIRTFVGKLMSLLFNMLSMFVIVFLPRSKHLLISQLQSPSAVIFSSVEFRSVAQSCPTLCNPLDCSSQAPLSFTISQSLFRLMSIELMVLFNHFILCCPLLLLPSIFPSIRVFSSKSALHNRWPLIIGASASASILPINLQSLFL